jgi:hypothetical protein
MYVWKPALVLRSRSQQRHIDLIRGSISVSVASEAARFCGFRQIVHQGKENPGSEWGSEPGLVRAATDGDDYVFVEYVEKERVERVIADDLAFLRAHPTRRRDLPAGSA